jgi:hypothetical protein
MRFLLLLLSLLIVLPVQAQTETPDPHPLLQLLALVPDNDGLDIVYYSDMVAAETALPAAGSYATWSELEAARNGSEEERNAVRLWLNKFPTTGAPNLARYLMQADSFPETMGFDLFDIKRALSFGTPPSQVQIFEGDFNAASITAARTANGFKQTEIGGFPAWCSEDGCDTGMNVSLVTRNTADIFGGELGRKQPGVLIDIFLLSSPDLIAVEAVAAAYNNEHDSLADNPVYTAAVEAITQEGLLRQAAFIPPDAIEKSTNSAPLPPYELLVIADSATEEEQRAVIALVYADADDAQTAAEILPSRWEQAQSHVAQRAWKDITADSFTELEAPTIYESENGVSVVALTFSYPPMLDKPDDETVQVITGLVYLRFLQALFARDLMWLAAD